MQIELPKICYFKNDGQKFMVLSYVGVSDQEESGIRIKNPPYGFIPSTWSEQWQSSIRETQVQGWKLDLRIP